MKFRNREMNISMWQGIRVVFAAIFITIFGLAGISHAAAAQPKTFASAEEAVKALIAAARSNDDKEMLAIFGPGAKELIFSGDAVADRQRRERFLKAYDEKNRLVQQGERHDPRDRQGGMAVSYSRDEERRWLGFRYR